MTNLKIRNEIEESRFKKYQIAAQMGISETSFSRLLRHELNPEQIARVRKAIKELSEQFTAEQDEGV